MAADKVWFGSYEGGPQPPLADFQAAEKFLPRSLLDYVKQQLREVQRKDGCVLVLFPGIWDAAILISRNAPHVFPVSSMRCNIVEPARL